MNTKTVLCLVAVCSLASAAIAQTPSLSELAKAEKERRAKIRATNGAAKLYTEGNQSGQAIAPTGGDQVASALPETLDGKKAKEKTPQELAAEKQQEWSERLKKAQDEIKSFEEAIAKNERALASMFNVTPARADMVAAVEADKLKLAALKQTLVDLEDERRRAGIPRPR